MNYKELVEKAQKEGLFTEKQMWQSVCSMSNLLEEMKKEHPQMFWDFMREQHGIMFGKHYMKEFAEYDVSQINYTDKEGKNHTGAYWSVDQIEEATKGNDIPKWRDKMGQICGIQRFLR